MSTPFALRYFEAQARVYRHTWRGTVISSFANPVMFLAAMGLGLGALVDENAGRGAIEGVTYLQFLAPGLMAATTMQAAAGDSAWPVMGGIKWSKTYMAALATPVRVADLVVGHLSFVAVRMAFVTTVFVVISALFGAMPLGWGMLATLPAILTGLAFSAPVFAYTASVERDTGLSNLFRFGIVPMFLFSGTFFPISQLPGWLQPVAAITPLWHGVELTRAAALQAAPQLPAAAHAAYLVLLAAGGTILAIRRLRIRLVS
jgi:lipooligosaccharide transport system permease protein